MELRVLVVADTSKILKDTSIFASVRSSTSSPTLFRHHRTALRVEHHGL